MNIKYSIECWIYHLETKTFLLLKCPETERHGTYYQPVTGGKEPQETFREAAVREVHEESGLSIEKEDLIEVLERFEVEVPDQGFIIHKPVYLIMTENSDVCISSEHIAFSWTDPAKVPEKLLWDSNRKSFGHVLEEVKKKQLKIFTR